MKVEWWFAHLLFGSVAVPLSILVVLLWVVGVDPVG